MPPFIIAKTPVVNFDPKREGLRLKALAEEHIRQQMGPIYDLTDVEARELYRATAEGHAETFFGPEWDIEIAFTVGEHWPKVIVKQYFND